MLGPIPLEIFYLVVAEIEQLDTLKSLSEVSKGFYPALVPFLCKKLVIFAPEHRLDEPRVPHWFQEDVRTNRLDRISFVKEIEVVSPIHYRLSDRCYADPSLNEHDMMNGFWNEDSNEESKHLKTEEALTKTLIRMFTKLSGNSLDSFSFHLGCCIPEQVFDSTSVDTKSLNSIESLSLITDGMCPAHTSRADSKQLLPTLKQLRNLSWRGISRHDGPDIKKLLDANYDHLESLELEGLYDYEREDDLPPISVFLGTKRLKALREISLCMLSIRLDTTFRDAVDVSKLRSLKFRGCYEVFSGFLGESPPPSHVVRLQSFEIDLETEGDASGSQISHPLISFLESFKGLEELYISIPKSTIKFPRLMNAILHHRTTLKRLVLRHVTDDASYNENELDAPLEHTFTSESEVSALDLFRELRLESVGVYVSPTILRRILEPYAAEQTFSLLHLRISGWGQERRDLRTFSPINDIPSMFEERFGRDPTEPKSPHKAKQLPRFLNWAFGPNGFPNLLIVAVGDFSNNGRYSWFNGLFCRNGDSDVQFEPLGNIKCVEDDDGLSEDDFEEGVQRDTTGSARRSFRRMRPGDDMLWDRIKGAKEMLSVLPASPILD